jgi:hypothetical protein
MRPKYGLAFPTIVISFSFFGLAAFPQGLTGTFNEREAPFDYVDYGLTTLKTPEWQRLWIFSTFIALA